MPTYNLQVDDTGKTLGPVSEEQFKPPLKPASPLDTLNEKQKGLATLTPLDRSMHMWRRVQCMLCCHVMHAHVAEGTLHNAVLSCGVGFSACCVVMSLLMVDCK
jgi:hypothetical protein